jgi:hypothetical protein
LAQLTYAYPTNAELSLIAQVKLPMLMMQDPIFQYFPIRNVNSAVVMWEQEDDYVGLQQVRGINGEFSRVKKTGTKRFVQTPGYYGEYEMMDEQELTEKRAVGSFADVIDVDADIARKQDKLLSREIDRIRYIAWTLATLGVFSVSLPTGGVAHTDTFPLQTYTASDWSTVSTATPILDFRGANLLYRGNGVSFGAGAVAYANLVTVNRLLGNTNSADIGGKLVVAGNSVVNLSQINTVLIDNTLPRIEVYDEGYKNDSGTFVPFIADDKVVIFGKRTDNGTVGEYQMTRNANNPNMEPGPYDEVIVNPKPPKTIEIYRGHNGGPAIFFPSAIIIMSV